MHELRLAEQVIVIVVFIIIIATTFGLVVWIRVAVVVEVVVAVVVVEQLFSVGCPGSVLGVAETFVVPAAVAVLAFWTFAAVVAGVVTWLETGEAKSSVADTLDPFGDGFIIGAAAFVGGVVAFAEDAVGVVSVVSGRS
jgi:hypothetical protein